MFALSWSDKFLMTREHFDQYLDWKDFTTVRPNENALINVVISYPFEEEADTEVFNVCLECIQQNDLRAGVTPSGKRIRHEPTDCDEVGCDLCNRKPLPRDRG
jgi:hypothetical protein